LKTLGFTREKMWKKQPFSTAYEIFYISAVALLKNRLVSMEKMLIVFNT